MAITNLANTKWQFVNEPALADAGTFAVNFTSNNTDYTSLTIAADKIKYGNDLAYGDPYPKKGDIITMNVDGTDKQFRVVKINGSVAEVLAMFNYQYKESLTGHKSYLGSNVDNALNTTWYATLNEATQAAIVDKNVEPFYWYADSSGSPIYNGYYGSEKPGTNPYILSKSSAAATAQSRHVYALSVQDILDYVLDTSIGDGLLQNYNIWKMFWNDEVAHSGTDFFLWVIGAYPIGNYAYIVAGSEGRISYTSSSSSFYFRPAFQIDLSKIDYTIST